jgi:hypothetical protein
MGEDFLQSQLDNVLEEAQRHIRDIEQYANNHVTDSPENVERELKERLEKFRAEMNQQIYGMENSITKHAPKINDPDYEYKKAHYKEFLIGGSGAIKKTNEVLGNVFSELGQVIVQIVQLIVQNLPTIVAVIVTLFKEVIFPLMNHKKGGYRKDKHEETSARAC